MKLYAKIQSERATKGQGGNKEIVIDLLIDPVKRMEIGRVVMTCEDDVYTVYYYPINDNCEDQKINSGRVLLYESKGEKQKGECIHDIVKDAYDKEYCQECGKYNVLS
jgi:hypothetical protein